MSLNKPKLSPAVVMAVVALAATGVGLSGCKNAEEREREYWEAYWDYRDENCLWDGADQVLVHCMDEKGEIIRLAEAKEISFDEAASLLEVSDWCKACREMAKECMEAKRLGLGCGNFEAHCMYMR